MEKEIKKEIGNMLESSIKKEAENSYKYDVFISYRHLEPDSSIARALHRLLEAYPVPGELKNRMKWRQRSFIDREELATKDLSDSIIDALKSSYALITVCSLQTKDSPWCEKEIELFRRFHGDDRIFVLLIEGEPKDAFLTPLKQLKKEGAPAGDKEHYKEILAADVRPQRVKDRLFLGYAKMDAGTLTPYLKDSLEILRQSEIHRIMAGIYGVSYGDMRQRQKERRLKLLFALTSSVSLALAVFGVSIFGLYQKSVRAERTARQQTALMTLDYADNALENGNRTLAVLIADKAMEETDGRMSRIDYIKALNYSVLNRALIYEPYTPISRIQTGRESPRFLLTPDSQRLISIGDTRNLQVWKLSNGEQLMDLKAPSNISAIAMEASGKGVYTALYDGRILYFNLEEESSTLLAKAPENYYGELGVSQDGSLLIGLVTGLGTLRMDVRSSREGTLIYSKVFSEENEFSYVLTNPKQNVIAYVTKNGKIMEIDLDSGTERERFAYDGDDLTAYSYTRNIDYSDDGKYLFHIRDDVLYRMESGNEKEPEIFSLPMPGRRMDIMADRLYITLLSTWDYAMGVYDLNTMELIGYVERGDGFINTFAVEEKTGDLAISWTSGDIGIWKANAAGGGENENGNYKTLSFIDSGEAGAVQFTKDGRYLAASALDGTISVIDTLGNENFAELAGGAVAQSGNFRYILLQDQRSFSCYDTVDESVTPMVTVKEDFGDFFSLFAIGDRGKTMALSGLLTRTAYLYEGGESAKRLVLPYEGEEDEDFISINDLVFAKEDESIFILYSNGEILEFSTKDGRLLRNFPPRSVEVMSMITDSKEKLAALNQVDGTTVLLDLETGEELFALEGEVYSIVGGREEEGGIEATGIVYDDVFHWRDGELTITSTNNLRQSVRGKYLHTNTISPDGRFLITALSGDVIVLTDTESGVFLKSFQGGESYHQKVFFNLASDRIIYKGGESVTKIESLPGEEELLTRAAELLDGRRMSEEELEKIGKSR